MENFVKFRHNVMNVHSISAFESIRGGINQNCKDVYFVRFVGVCDTLAADVRRMDGDMAERMARGCVIYRRMPGLPSGFCPDCLADYEAFYREWLGSGSRIDKSLIRLRGIRCPAGQRRCKSAGAICREENGQRIDGEEFCD